MWFENLVTKQSGSEAITIVLSAHERNLSPTTNCFEPVLAADFLGNLDLLVTVEIGYGVLLLAVRVCSVLTEATFGSWSIRKLYLNRLDQKSEATDRRATGLRTAELLSEMASLDDGGLLLAADTFGSTV